MVFRLFRFEDLTKSSVPSVYPHAKGIVYALKDKGNIF
ncbi:hypothetical protein OROMI_028081 [Orobanche minor]